MFDYTHNIFKSLAFTLYCYNVVIIFDCKCGCLGYILHYPRDRKCVAGRAYLATVSISFSKPVLHDLYPYPTPKTPNSFLSLPLQLLRVA